MPWFRVDNRKKQLYVAIARVNIPVGGGGEMKRKGTQAARAG